MFGEKSRIYIYQPEPTIDRRISVIYSHLYVIRFIHGQEVKLNLSGM